MPDDQLSLLARAVAVLERGAALLPDGHRPVDWQQDLAAAWQQGPLRGQLTAHGSLDPMQLSDLLHIDRQQEQVVANTAQFVAGLPANNVLLWGSRGTGKSSLVHALLNRFHTDGLRLVEVDKVALLALPDIVAELAGQPFRFILFCDDLSFEQDEPAYKVLKSVLDGSVFQTSDNVLLYATSNRRHLLPETMADNQQMRHEVGADGIAELHPGEAIEEKISLSDRFGLWVSFRVFPQDEYLGLTAHWLAHYAKQADLPAPALDANGELAGECRAEALRWALARGHRSGRAANQFARHWVGREALARQG